MFENRWRRWQPRAFQFSMYGGLQFAVASLVAMFFYAGGNSYDSQAAGYHFFRNFFSDLGLTVAHNGQTNTISSALFFIALTTAGLSLIIFFLFIPGLLATGWPTRVLAILGSVAGVLSGVGFIGVAFTPANLYLEAHINAVLLAFMAFFVAVLFHLAAIFSSARYPNRLGLVYLFFAVVLGGYLYLLFYGPDTASLRGLTIQVAGQKAVVYAAISSITIQSYGARQILAGNRQRPPAAGQLVESA